MHDSTIALRVMSRIAQSPLASLIADVKGARELLSGTTTDTSTLGVSAPEEMARLDDDDEDA